MTLAIGRIFAGRYSIESLLGEGGMGSVYRVHDSTLDRLAALKVVRVGDGGSTGASNTTARARLLREARSAAAFAHPNAVSIYDVGEVDGITYIAMELIEGRTLRAHIDDPSAPLAVRIGWLPDVARALAAAHRRGIIHRDVKPENVMITREGIVKVLDFGIARKARTETDALAPTQKNVESLTGAGAIVGTPLYMAPEQIHGDELDARVDQFAWGLIAHEVMTGELPWGRERNAPRNVADMFSQPPRSARDKIPEMPEELQMAISRALSRSPADRCETMDDLVAMFTADPTGTGPMKRPAGRTRVGGRARVRLGWRYYAAGGAAFACLLVAAVARSPWQKGSPPALSKQAPDAARGLAITDVPLPASDHPDAIDAYKAALRGLRTSNLDTAEDNLKLALQRDPELAAANLRLVPIALERSGGVDPAPPYRRAIQLRERLSDRDRQILDAYALLVETDPADYQEASLRFERLVAARSDDAEVADDLARVDVIRGDGAAARVAIDHALAIDPAYGDAWMLKVESERTMGQFAEAAADADACFARFTSLDCLLERSVIAQFTAAPDAISIARKQQALAPDSVEAAMALAGALFVSGADPAALEAAFNPARATMSKRAQDYFDSMLAVLAGDFARARDGLVKWRDSAPPIRTKQSRIAWILVSLDEEMGDGDMALRDAEKFASAMPAFSSARVPAYSDPIMPVLRVLQEHGKLTRDDYARQRASFVEASASHVGATGRALVWLVAYAEAVRNAEDAKEALEAAPGLGEPTYQPMGGAPVGHVHLLAGDLAGALPDLQRGARSTDVFINPIASMRARLELGLALERGGDRAGACAQYAVLVTAWGSATPKSVSLAEARDRRRALSCPAN